MKGRYFFLMLKARRPRADGEKELDTAEIYDPFSQTWELVWRSSLHHERVGGGQLAGGRETPWPSFWTPSLTPPPREGGGSIRILACDMEEPNSGKTGDSGSESESCFVNALQ